MPSLLRAALGAACISAAGLFAACVMSACTVNQTLALSAGGSGTLTTHAEVSPVLRDYLVSLSGMSGAGTMKDGRVFDAYSVRKGFQSRPGLRVRSIETPTSSSLDLDLGFDSLQEAVRGQGKLADAGAISVRTDGDLTTLRLHLDRSTWAQIASLFPPLQNPVVQQLGPQGTGEVSEADYLSMIGFSIGDAAPGLLKKSFITLTVHPDGDIVSQSGGTVSDDTVVFRIPVLRVLVLDTALDYSVTFRAP